MTGWNGQEWKRSDYIWASFYIIAGLIVTGIGIYIALTGGRYGL